MTNLLYSFRYLFIFSPEPGRKGVSIVDYLPGPKSEAKKSKTENKDMRVQQIQPVQQVQPVQPTLQVQTIQTMQPLSVTIREAAVKQRKFSFKSGKVR